MIDLAEEFEINLPNNIIILTKSNESFFECNY